MAIFLVETYSGVDTVRVRDDRDRAARCAADEMTRGGSPVRFAGSIHVPTDEMCFIAFDTDTSGLAALTAQRAGFEPLRVVHAVAPVLGPATHQNTHEEESP